MSDQEQTKEMIQSLVEKFDNHCVYVKDELTQIKRGVYGDPANKVPGLLDRQEKDEERISTIELERKLEKDRKKTIIWVGGVIWATIQAIFIGIYELFFSKS